MKKRNSDLLTDSVNDLLIKLATPLMVSGLLRMSYSFIDMIFASRLGGVQVASVALVAPLFLLVESFGLGLSSGGVSIIAKALGEDDSSKAAAYASQLRILILLFALLVSIPGVLFSNSIVEIFSAERDLHQNATLYTKIRFLSIPFAMSIELYSALYKSQGKMSITMILAFLGILCNIVFNGLFIGILKMGIGGLAFATLITMFIQAVYVLYDYHKADHSFSIYWIGKERFLDRELCGRLFHVGLPLVFALGSAQLGYLLINIIIVPYGYQVMAAFAIGNQVNTLLFEPATGLSQAMVPLIAQNWGRRAMERIRDIINRSMSFAIIFGVAGALLIQLIIDPLGTFLSKGDEVIISHVLNYIRMMGWTLIAWCIFQSLSGIFDGFQKTTVTMTISIIRLWCLRIPGLLAFRYLLPTLEEYGVWYTMVLSNVITALLALLTYLIYIPKILCVKNNSA